MWTVKTAQKVWAGGRAGGTGGEGGEEGRGRRDWEAAGGGGLAGGRKRPRERECVFCLFVKVGGRFGPTRHQACWAKVPA